MRRNSRLRILCIVKSSKAVQQAKLCSNEYSHFKLGYSAGRPTLIITRSGLNKLILNSRKPGAVEFKNWLAREVIPTLQDEGMYVVGEEKVRIGEMSIEEMTIRVMSSLQEKVSRLSLEKAAAEAKVIVLEKEITFLTVDEYRALGHMYWSMTVSEQMGKIATLLSYENNWAMGGHIRKFTLPTGRVVEHLVKEYTREARDVCSTVS